MRYLMMLLIAAGLWAMPGCGEEEPPEPQNVGEKLDEMGDKVSGDWQSFRQTMGEKLKEYGQDLDDLQRLARRRKAVWLAILGIAWFWLLSPTQNPWYWTWAMPLVMFARCRAWLLVSGLALTYYLRFWLDFHFVETEVLGTPYTGAPFFDFVVTWLEFGPWFVLLSAEAVWPRSAHGQVDSAVTQISS